jgi:hypothetical protein
MVAVTAKASWSIDGAKELTAAGYERKFAKLHHATLGVPGGPRRPHRSATAKRKARAIANRIGMVRSSRDLCSDGIRRKIKATAMPWLLLPFAAGIHFPRRFIARSRDETRDPASGPGAGVSRNARTIRSSLPDADFRALPKSTPQNTVMSATTK